MGAQSSNPSLAFQVIRPEDMLYLGFEFYNAKGVVKNGQTYIVPTDPACPTYTRSRRCTTRSPGSPG